MASTELTAAPGVPALRQVEFLVPDYVRVREEDFGLLFYDVRSTRLTFVRSGEDLTAPPLAGSRRVLGVRWSEESRRPALSRVLQYLLSKGLVVAAEPE